MFSFIQIPLFISLSEKEKHMRNGSTGIPIYSKLTLPH